MGVEQGDVQGAGGQALLSRVLRPALRLKLVIHTRTISHSNNIETWTRRKHSWYQCPSRNLTNNIIF